MADRHRTAALTTGLPERPDYAAIEDAAERLAGVARPTRLEHSRTFSLRSGAKVFLKLENEQRTGSFKLRGAYNLLSRLTPAERRRGVITASAGNHAQGVALAAAMLGAPAVVVMPETAAISKVEATRSYGAEIVLAGNSFDAAAAHAEQLQQARKLTFVPAYDHPAIIAGQGTIGLEILDTLPEVDAVVVPVGGGGLISGIALAIKARRPATAVYGVQTANVGVYRRALAANAPAAFPIRTTLADGIAVKTPGQLTFPIIRDYVDDIVEVSEEETAQAMVLLLERQKTVVEGAGAIALAAVLAGKLPVAGKSVVCIVSGGNIDLSLLARVVQNGLTAAGCYLVVRVLLPDQPGQLQRLIALIAQERANILEILHHRAGWRLPPQTTEVELVVETRNAEHSAEILERLRAAGYHQARAEASHHWLAPEL